MCLNMSLERKHVRKVRHSSDVSIDEEEEEEEERAWGLSEVNRVRERERWKFEEEGSL